MKVKDYFLSKQIFELKETEIPGVLKTSPIPEDLDKYYESPDYISHNQDQGGLKEKLYKQFQKLNLNFKRNLLAKELPKRANVLDYGCGAGEFLKFIEDDFTTFGYEPSVIARNYAEKKLSRTKLISDLNEIEDNYLDAITLWHVFEHIEDQDVKLESFYNKLKHNGLLIIAVPNHSSYDAQKYKQFWAAYDVPRHIFHFSKSGMEKMMNNNKWIIKYTRPLLFDAFYISMLSEKYKKSPLFWLKGFIFGAISNFKASKSGEFSSVIYVIQKK